jgi:3-oxoacyl-[acyl-carrier protein] reductase
MEETGALAGKVAVVTGAARNIGREIALALGGEGAAVLVNALSDAKAAGTVAGEVTAAGGRGLAHLADVTDEAAANGMADAAVQAFGRIDILVCNAGIRRQHPFTEVSFAEWRDVLAVSLDGAFLCAKACVPHMIAGGGGAIITLGASTSHMGTRNRVHVLAAKMGLVGLTRALATELGEHGITVNCVAPGHIDTVRGASAGQRSAQTPRPIERMGRPDEIAAMVRHLCLPGGAYITGCLLYTF